MALLPFRLVFAEVSIHLIKYCIMQLLALKKKKKNHPIWFFASQWEVSSGKITHLCRVAWGQAVNPIHDENHVLYFLFLFLIIAVHTLAFCYSPILSTLQTLKTSGSGLKTLFWSFTDVKFVRMELATWLWLACHYHWRHCALPFPSVLFHNLSFPPVVSMQTKPTEGLGPGHLLVCEPHLLLCQCHPTLEAEAAIFYSASWTSKCKLCLEQLSRMWNGVKWAPEVPTPGRSGPSVSGKSWGQDRHR